MTFEECVASVLARFDVIAHHTVREHTRFWLQHGATQAEIETLLDRLWDELQEERARIACRVGEETRPWDDWYQLGGSLH